MERLRRLIQIGFVPVFALGFGGLAVAGISAGWGWPPLIVLVLAAIATSYAAEGALPYREAWNESRGDAGRDVLHAIVNAGSAVASVGLLPALAVVLDGLALAPWPADWPFAVQVVAAILVFDLGVTFAHYASHRLEILWRFHAVHHSVERMYGLNGLMKHPVHQAIEMTAGIAPLLLFGLPLGVAKALAVCTALQLLLQHSNVDYRLGPFRRVLALAEIHRFHHRGEPGLGDVNFGLFTTLGDRVLGTAFDDPAAPRLESRDLGIHAEPDYPVPWAAQMVEPFRARDGRVAEDTSLGTPS